MPANTAHAAGHASNDPDVDNRLAQLYYRATKDFGGLESLYAADFQATDHRALRFGDGDRDAWMTRERSRADVVVAWARFRELCSS